MPEAVHRRRSDPSGEPVTDGDAREESLPPEDLLSVLSDDYAREILQSVSSECLAAREIADRLDVSRPTVYRRLNRLEEAGLVTTSMTYDPDGHHRRHYRAAFEEVVLSMDSGRLVVDRSA
jgi:predicted transcriptional regulator